MLHKRLVSGTILASAMAAVLLGDLQFLPYAPFLFACAMLAAIPATYEFLRLLPGTSRPRTAIVATMVILVLGTNWWPLIEPGADLWRGMLLLLVFSAIVAFLLEMATFRENATSTTRVSFTILTLIYLGLLPSFFLQLRWLFAEGEVGSLALAATIFVPKCGDIGAYFTGKAIGRHRFTPILSPKKTWEGFAGGMVFSVGAAIGLSTMGPLFQHGIIESVGFGLTLGLVGVLGDLAESMVKRDAGTKDAAKSIPGFGGVLDVIDSVVFAGPVAYVWFTQF
jgi:phosphatidate cytidylyltransferase